MELIFTIIIYLNIPMAIAAFVFAAILLSRSRGNPVYFNFGMSVLSLALWILVTFFSFFFIGPITLTFWLLSSYFFGLWIIYFFLMFTYKYPFSQDVKKLTIYILYTLSALVVLTIFVPNLYIFEDKLDFPFIYEKTNPIGLTIFSTYFIIFATLSFINLFKSYWRSDGIHKVQLKKIIIGTLVAVLANLIFSLFIYYFSTFESTPVGILFTFGVLIYIYSILFSKKQA